MLVAKKKMRDADGTCADDYAVFVGGEPAAVAARLNEKLAPLWDAQAHVRLLKMQVNELKEQVENLQTDKEKMREQIRKYKKIFSMRLTRDQVISLWNKAEEYREENQKNASEKQIIEQQEQKRMRMR